MITIRASEYRNRAILTVKAFRGDDVTNRAKFIATADEKKLRGWAWDAMMLASTHDPDHAKELRAITDRLNIIERQLERIGAPQYRKVRTGVYAEIVRGPRSAKNLKDK
jgi:hypothetical protein